MHFLKTMYHTCLRSRMTQFSFLKYTALLGKDEHHQKCKTAIYVKYLFSISTMNCVKGSKKLFILCFFQRFSKSYNFTEHHWHMFKLSNIFSPPSFSIYFSKYKISILYTFITIFIKFSQR